METNHRQDMLTGLFFKLRGEEFLVAMASMVGFGLLYGLLGPALGLYSGRAPRLGELFGIGLVISLFYELVFLYLPVSAGAWALCRRLVARPAGAGLLNCLPYVLHSIWFLLMMAPSMPWLYAAWASIILYDFGRAYWLVKRRLDDAVPETDEIFA
ncbi:MAG: hypothetical protein EP335_15425 [Alphaproteobacteria bacterium]|nr:MAG: hypothetical protein EP335_15425 [Alphaproteobacteria bacterium]